MSAPTSLPPLELAALALLVGHGPMCAGDLGDYVNDPHAEGGDPGANAIALSLERRGLARREAPFEQWVATDAGRALVASVAAPPIRPPRATREEGHGA